jgi:N-methylhydantoinase B
MAQGGSSPSWILIAVGKDRRGNPYHRIIPINGGLGALPRKDGEVATFPANLSNTPVEMLDDAMHVVIESKEIIPDSAGPGKYRGGFGQRVAFRAADPMIYSVLASRIQHPPQGLLGGKPGRAGKIFLNGREIGPGDGQLLPGDVIVFETPGGGGLHPPTERPVELVVADVEEGLVSIGQAREAYGVALDPVTGEADLNETERLRLRMRAADREGSSVVREPAAVL